MSTSILQNSLPPRFIADTMLGRLAKWLRILGYDTAYPGQETDQRLARLSAEEGRILLTRDVDLAARKGFQKLLIHSTDIWQQVREVVDAFDLTVNDRAFSICSVCNQSLAIIEKKSVPGRVPAYVLRTQDRFYHCSGCDRIYWAGTHLDHIRRELKKLGYAL